MSAAPAAKRARSDALSLGTYEAFKVARQAESEAKLKYDEAVEDTKKAEAHYRDWVYKEWWAHADPLLDEIGEYQRMLDRVHRAKSNRMRAAVALKAEERRADIEKRIEKITVHDEWRDNLVEYLNHPERRKPIGSRTFPRWNFPHKWTPPSWMPEAKCKWIDPVSKVQVECL